MTRRVPVNAPRDQLARNSKPSMTSDVSVSAHTLRNVSTPKSFMNPPAGVSARGSYRAIRHRDSTTKPASANVPVESATTAQTLDRYSITEPAAADVQRRYRAQEDRLSTRTSVIVPAHRLLHVANQKSSTNSHASASAPSNLPAVNQRSLTNTHVNVDVHIPLQNAATPRRTTRRLAHASVRTENVRRTKNLILSLVPVVAVTSNNAATSDSSSIPKPVTVSAPGWKNVRRRGTSVTIRVTASARLTYRVQEVKYWTKAAVLVGARGTRTKVRHALRTSLWIPFPASVRATARVRLVLSSIQRLVPVIVTAYVSQDTSVLLRVSVSISHVAPHRQLTNATLQNVTTTPTNTARKPLKN